MWVDVNWNKMMFKIIGICVQITKTGAIIMPDFNNDICLEKWELFKRSSTYCYLSDFRQNVYIPAMKIPIALKYFVVVLLVMEEYVARRRYLCYLTWILCEEYLIFTRDIAIHLWCLYFSGWKTKHSSETRRTFYVGCVLN